MSPSRGWPDGAGIDQIRPARPSGPGRRAPPVMAPFGEGATAFTCVCPKKQTRTFGYSCSRTARFSSADMLLIMYSSGSRTEPWTKSVLARLHHARPGAQELRVLLRSAAPASTSTAAAATGLNQSRSVERSVTARSWLPVIDGHPELPARRRNTRSGSPRTRSRPRGSRCPALPRHVRRTASSASSSRGCRRSPRTYTVRRSLYHRRARIADAAEIARLKRGWPVR